MSSSNITSTKGKVISDVSVSGSFATLHLQTRKGTKAGQITIRLDACFDAKGNRYERE
jgi:hypothetical protein